MHPKAKLCAIDQNFSQKTEPKSLASFFLTEQKAASLLLR